MTPSRLRAAACLRRLWNDRNRLPMDTGYSTAVVDLDGMSAHVLSGSLNLPGVTAPGTRPAAASVRGGAPNPLLEHDRQARLSDDKVAS